VAIAVALGVLAGVTPLGAAPQAMAQDGGDVPEACAPAEAIPEVGTRGCKSIEALTWGTARGCRAVDPLQEPLCPALDGRAIHPQAMTDFEASWLHRALDLQRRLDLEVPLSQALIPHTHNSANSSAYAPSLSNLDANQVLSLTDQLRLGMRAIEIDIHWVPNPSGDPDNDFRAVVQCHGQPVATPAGVLHAGCSVDTPLIDLLREVRAWLDQPANADEVVLLYLENALDGDPAAHASAAASIESTLGDLVARPESGDGCQALPVARSKQQLLDAGTRVLITGNCGPGGWTDWVFDRYPSWDESGGSTFDCATERAEIPSFDSILVRRYEDSTWLSAMAGSGSHRDAGVMAAMVQCGVNLVGFDQVHAGDDRLPSLVWSWRADEPAADAAGQCAALGDDGRFFADACTARRPIACRTETGSWALTEKAAAWKRGDDACQRAGHIGAGVPHNGWDNAQLAALAEDAGIPEVWLAYGQDATGTWVTGIPAAAHPPKPKPPKPGPQPAASHGYGVPPAATASSDAPKTTPAAASSPVPGALAGLTVALVLAAMVLSRRRIAVTPRS
jgi:hypothetical protein